MNKVITMMACIYLVSTMFVSAADRNARAIDTLGVLASSPADVDTVKVTLWSEQTLAQSCDNWAVLVGVSGGVESPTGEKNHDFWQAGLGLKYYLDSLTSLTLRGEYGQYYNLTGNPDFRICTGEVKRRLIDASNPISPFVVAFYSLADGEIYKNLEHTIGILAGSDFMLTDTMALSIQGGYAQSEGDKDGFMCSIALICYWDEL